jgi:hypothetical protein
MDDDELRIEIGTIDGIKQSEQWRNVILGKGANLKQLYEKVEKT